MHSRNDRDRRIDAHRVRQGVATKRTHWTTCSACLLFNNMRGWQWCHSVYNSYCRHWRYTMWQQCITHVINIICLQTAAKCCF